MKKIIILTLCIITMLVSCNTVFAKENNMRNNICVNGQFIETGSVVKKNLLLLPFRAILEALGAKVDWDAVTQNTNVYYREKQYMCEIEKPNPSYEHYYFYVEDMESNEGINLNPMGKTGLSEIIDDHIYLYQDTAERLFTALGCTVDVNSEEKCVYITAKEQVVTSLDRVKN